MVHSKNSNQSRGSQRRQGRKQKMEGERVSMEGVESGDDLSRNGEWRHGPMCSSLYNLISYWRGEGEGSDLVFKAGIEAPAEI